MQPRADIVTERDALRGSSETIVAPDINVVCGTWSRVNDCRRLTVQSMTQGRIGSPGSLCGFCRVTEMRSDRIVICNLRAKKMEVLDGEPLTP